MEGRDTGMGEEWSKKLMAQITSTKISWEGDTKGRQELLMSFISSIKQAVGHLLVEKAIWQQMTMCLQWICNRGEYVVTIPTTPRLMLWGKVRTVLPGRGDCSFHQLDGASPRTQILLIGRKSSLLPQVLSSASSLRVTCHICNYSCPVLHFSYTLTRCYSWHCLRAAHQPPRSPAASVDSSQTHQQHLNLSTCNSA